MFYASLIALPISMGMIVYSVDDLDNRWIAGAVGLGLMVFSAIGLGFGPVF